jgi:hypothetical protein
MRELIFFLKNIFAMRQRYSFLFNAEIVDDCDLL